jgi:hypothetical protein
LISRKRVLHCDAGAPTEATTLVRDPKAETWRHNELCQVGGLFTLQEAKNEEIVFAISNRVACGCA